MFLLDSSVGETIVNVILGLFGFCIVILLLIYLKAFLAKVSNTKYIDRSGRTVMEPDSFDNINEFIGDKISEMKNKVTTTIAEKSRPATKQPIPVITSDLLITPGKSVGDIRLGDPISKVIELYGEEYTLITHNSYSYEYVYRTLGMSFYLRLNDSNKKVFSIKLFPPCIAKTKKGIAVIESTLKDVIAAYGAPKGYTSPLGLGSDLLNATYSGIQFGIHKNTNPDSYKTGAIDNRKKKILQIQVGD